MKQRRKILSIELAKTHHQHFIPEGKPVYYLYKIRYIPEDAVNNEVYSTTIFSCGDELDVYREWSKHYELTN